MRLASQPSLSVIALTLAVWVLTTACTQAVYPADAKLNTGSVTLTGSGGSGAAPLLQLSAERYREFHTLTRVDYQTMGSFAGIQNIIDRKSLFGVCDCPPSDELLRRAPAKLITIPITVQALVIAYNLEGENQPLILDGITLSRIFSGEIKSWSDPAISRLNPKRPLPDVRIVPLHYKGGSAITYAFTDYLCRVSDGWAKNVGKGVSVEWPAGEPETNMGPRLKKTMGAIACISLPHARVSELKFAALINKAGKPSSPSQESVQLGILSSDIPGDFRTSVMNPPGEKSYPIQYFSYALMYDDLTYLNDAVRAKELVDFIKWCVTDGQKNASDLHYVALPDELQQKLIQKLDAIRVK